MYHIQICIYIYTVANIRTYDTHSNLCLIFMNAFNIICNNVIAYIEAEKNVGKVERRNGGTEN